jgi:FtsH-binding integral membrane protein
MNMDNKTYEYVEDRSMTIQQYINNIFKWMVIGVLTTFVTAFALEKSSFMSYAGMLPFILIIFQFAVVIGLSMKPITAKVLYMIYSVITGVTFSYVIASYTSFSVALAFLVAAIYFGVLVVLGTVIKMDLTRIGTICLAGLFVYIIFSVIVMIFNLGVGTLIMPLISLALFAGITAYDMQKSLQLYNYASSNPEMLEKLSIYGAFNLYLDFVNIFLDILQLLGDNK